jgi:decaprenylphospho-beta-D-erythro-pentofuranosid-2-ulose 2-reductase
VNAHPANRVVLVGGTSEIGLAIVRRLAADGPVRPCLVGRDGTGLERALGALESAGCSGGHVEVLDADDLAAHDAALGRAFAACGGPDVVIIAIGVLGAQAGLDAGIDEAIDVMRVDFVSAGSLLIHCLRRLRSQRRGTLVVLSSVAAERPRAGNPVYGAAKAGLDALAQGLADSAQGTGVRVLVVRPGFVRTKMTEGLEAAPFTTSPEAVADATVAALARGAHTVWVPAALRGVFSILRHVPRPIYRRLPL